MMEPSFDSHGQSIIVIDLDGTLIRGNSLRLYMKYALGKLPFGAKWSLIWLLTKRLMRITSHREMKFRLLNMTKELDVQKFVNKLQKRVRQEILTRYPAQRIVLATAAPARWAYPLANELKIATCLSTLETETLPEYVENRGEVKKLKITQLDLPIDTIITDHYDDIPTLRLPAREKILLNPSNKTLKKFNKYKVNCKLEYMK